MENSKKSLEALQEIRLLMERSTRFLSLSGVSGLYIGGYALVAIGYIFWQTDFRSDWLTYVVETQQIHLVAYPLLLTLVLSLLTGFFLAHKKAGGLRWDLPTRRLLFHLGIPLLTGGLLCLIWILQGRWEFILPSTLLFYGLALLNASKYTWEDLQSMGLSLIFTGLVVFAWPAYALHGWAFGFGLLHLLYGLSIHLKYEK